MLKVSGGFYSKGICVKMQTKLKHAHCGMIPDRTDNETTYRHFPSWSLELIYHTSKNYDDGS